jgi:hypothetical protein
MFKMIFEKLMGLVHPKTPAKRPPWRPTVAVDFDGVIHSYASGWQGVGVAGDPPVGGAMTFLADHCELLDIAIHSCRSHSIRGQIAMRRYIKQALLYYFSNLDNAQELATHVYRQIRFPVLKPPAVVYLDDRAVQFQGTFPNVTDIRNFKPWNKRGPRLFVNPDACPETARLLMTADFTDAQAEKAFGSVEEFQRQVQERLRETRARRS